MKVKANREFLKVALYIMKIADSFTVKSSVKKSWDFLFDPENLISCIPGCEKVVRIDQNNYISTVKIKVGYIPAKFKIKTTITEINAPTHLSFICRGEDKGKAGFVSMDSILHLKPLSGDMTEIAYTSDLNVVGRLSTFGDRIIKAKVKQLGEKFKEEIKFKLERG
ncbi:MAG: SRPBCC domain-containing protein [Thermodesulfobacteriota bacterium]|nr:SRPBCC domain-containing protein [Thermodesulfobacteriota bacterium]